MLIISLIFFQYCQPAQNQPKSQFLFPKNCSLRLMYNEFGCRRHLFINKPHTAVCVLLPAVATPQNLSFFASDLNHIKFHSLSKIFFITYKARPCTITRRVIVRCVIYFYQVNHTFFEIKCLPINSFHLFFYFFYEKTIFVLKNKVHIK